MLKGIFSAVILYSTAATLVSTDFAPLSWGVAAFFLWLLFLVYKGWACTCPGDRYMLAWGWSSVAAFNTFALLNPGFQVYFLLTLGQLLPQCQECITIHHSFFNNAKQR